MNEKRHVNPQLDPRKPRHNSHPFTNPPVFVWWPEKNTDTFTLIVAKDAALTQVILRVDALDIPYFLPDAALAPGRYFWTWSDGRGTADVMSFEMTASATQVVVPKVEELFRLLPAGHPRVYTRREELDSFRASRTGLRATRWNELKACADTLLAQSHELAEPPPVPDYHTQHDAWYYAYSKAMDESRRFLAGAEGLALAFLASGEARYGRAAAQRMVSVSKWDPAGSTWIEHNDEPHMSIVNWGPIVCDWVWEFFTEAELALVTEQFRRRGELAERFIRSMGHFGANHYGSHHGREVVFMGMVCLVFHERIPEARRWMEWLRPLLCGIWPVWAGEDGAWAEGPHYSTAYVGVMARFVAALKTGTGVDLFRRPFWKGYLEWRLQCTPANVEWIGFGDGNKYAGHEEDVFTADLIRLISRFTGTTGLEAFARAHAPDIKLMGARLDLSYLYPMVYHFDPVILPDVNPVSTASPDMLRVFPGAGWAAIHSSIQAPERDVILTFRSSPFGSVSHSHADNNGFALHVAGKSLAMPSGIYDGYATSHHSHWVWHTKSANCLTLSDAGQIMRSADSVGSIDEPFEDTRLVYFRGTADASYGDRAQRCRRHVVYLKQHGAFLMVDEFIPRPGIVSAMQWNIHSWSQFQMAKDGLSFLLERGDSSLEGTFLWHAQSFYHVSDEMDPPPLADGYNRTQWGEYHLRFTSWGLVEKGRNLGVLLCAGHPNLKRAVVTTALENGIETARIGNDHILVHPETITDTAGLATVARMTIDGHDYLLGNGPIRNG